MAEKETDRQRRELSWGYKANWWPKSQNITWATWIPTHCSIHWAHISHTCSITALCLFSFLFLQIFQTFISLPRGWSNTGTGFL